MTRTLFALSQHATACDNKLQIAVRNDMRLFLRTTKYYSVLKKVLLQYYPVVQSTPPYYSVLQSVLRTTKCYSSTTLYYTALLCSTNYYSSTTLYYKVLLQYYSVLQSTTPVLQSAAPVLLYAAKYYSSTILYYEVLILIFTKCCACHEK